VVEETPNTFKCVRREFIADEFGGERIGMYVRPKGMAARHGIPLILCPNLKLNPYAPILPGHPGLLFSIHHRPWRDEKKKGKEIEKVAPMFVRLEVNNWAYVGDYVERGEKTLSTEQWRSQSDEVCASLSECMLQNELICSI
jgi:hypothetical protein